MDMFIYSVRASTIKILGVFLLLGVLLTVLVVTGQGDSVSAASTATEVDFSGIKTKEDRLAFIRGFGIEVDESSEQESAFQMPDNFDRVVAGYNILQQKQGLDLSKYKNKKVTRYTYKVTNYKDDGEVFANLFIYRGKVVACDLSSIEQDGFVIPLTLVSRDNLK